MKSNSSSQKVFLSSTKLDLIELRSAAEEAIHGLDGYEFVGMERFGTRDEMPLKYCLQCVRQCDIFVGIFGHRYGSCPPNSDKSFTEHEYDEALRLNKQRLLFFYEFNFFNSCGFKTI